MSEKRQVFSPGWHFSKKATEIWNQDMIKNSSKLVLTCININSNSWHVSIHISNSEWFYEIRAAIEFYKQ